MTARARERATYDDLLKAPPNLIAELVEGELHLSPRPAPRHVNFASALGGFLVPPYQFGRGGPGGWWIMDEPEIHFEPRKLVLVPDMAGWRRERMPQLPETAWFEVVPDWICEVLSTSTIRFHRTVKMPAYARYGVQNVWVADPLARTVEIKRNHEDGWLTIATYGGTQRFATEPFHEVEIDLGAIWGEDESPPSP